MNIVNYKGTNLRVSDIALGGGVLGSRISDQASFDILDCFVGNGGTFIDTANVYGRWNPGNLPLSELLIGRWMKQHRLRSKPLQWKFCFLLLSLSANPSLLYC